MHTGRMGGGMCWILSHLLAASLPLSSCHTCVSYRAGTGGKDTLRSERFMEEEGEINPDPSEATQLLQQALLGGQLPKWGREGRKRLDLKKLNV